MKALLFVIVCCGFSSQSYIAAMQQQLPTDQCVRTNKDGTCKQPCDPWRSASDGCYFCMNKHLQNPSINIDALSPDGFTLLHYAATCGHPHLVRLLLACNANTAITVNGGYYAGRTALELARTAFGENFQLIVTMLSPSTTAAPHDEPARPAALRKDAEEDSENASNASSKKPAVGHTRTAPPPPLVAPNEGSQHAPFDPCDWSDPDSNDEWIEARGAAKEKELHEA